MDTAHEWSQEVGMVKVAMEEETAPSSCSKPSMLVLEKKVRPQKDQATNCPRCNSANTKFCYYNNYSLTQPRYFCKTCRRYWTAGGSLRNVPVGGGSRKNKIRISSLSNPPPSSPSAANSSHKIPDLNPPPISFSSQNPKTHEGQDLNLAFPPVMQDYLSISQFVEMPKNNINQNQHHNSNNQHHFSPSSSATTTSSQTLSAIDLLRSTGIASRGFSSFFSMPMPMPDSNALYNSSGFHLQELKPNISLNSVDGLGISRYGSLHGVVEENGGARLMFPFGVVKQVSSTSTSTHDQVDQNKGQGNPTGYWNGMFGTQGGSW